MNPLVEHYRKMAAAKMAARQRLLDRLADARRRGDEDEEIVCLAKLVPTHFADLVITAASVAWVSGAQPQIGVLGTTVTAGQTIYLDRTTQTYKLAKSNLAGAWPAIGVALTGGSSGAYFMFAGGGATINIGATLVKNTFYFLSGANAGGIAPLADITAGWETVTVGIAATTANMTLIFSDTGITN